MNTARTRLKIAAVTYVLFLSLTAPSFGADGKAVTSITIEPLESGKDVILTFAHPFKKGDIPETLELRDGEYSPPAQVEVKRRYSDGSVKHAIISTSIRDVTADKSLTLDIHSAKKRRNPNTGVSVYGGPLRAEVTFRFPDGSERIAKASEFLSKATDGVKDVRLLTWLDGPLFTELQIAGPPLNENGQGDPDILVLFGLRIFNKSLTFRVEVVVESPWIDVPGNIPYDISVSVNDEEVFAQKNVGHWKHRMPYWIKDGNRSLGHFAHSRWRKVFWVGKEPPKTHIRYDLDYLVSTGLLPPYDTDLDISNERLERSLKNWNDSPRDLLENGIIMAYFPTTGGREDLGPYPTWTTRYLLSGDPRAWEMVLGTGDLAGSFPVHQRDRKTGRIFSIDDHPGYSLNPRGTLEKIPPRPAADRPYLRPATSPYAVDCAHQPSLAFIPYLLTGEYYYLEEMHFWANWCMLTQNAAYRDKEKGLLAFDQTRGEAWALRQLVDAAKICPDDIPEKQYFDSKVKTNLEYYNSFIVGPDATPLGTYTAGASDAFVRGRSPEERRKWLTLAPWQQNFLAWCMDHAVRAGYPQAARPRDYFTTTQAGVLTHPDQFDPSYGASYFLVVGEREAEKIRYYRTWKELFEKSFRVVSPDAKPSLPGGDYGSSYAHIARAVLLNGVRNDVPRAKEALKVLEPQLPNLQKVLANDPTWAFTR
ncbi:MAG: hypothetical protein ACYS8Z_05700 [Planctomycetota bacterium]|jgi:hypothetical protein